MRTVRPLGDADRPHLSELLLHSWGSTRMASRGRLLELSRLRGFVAVDGDAWLGYAEYEMVVESLEVVVLERLVPSLGVGSALLAECVRAASDHHLRRLWLITTNDNVTALRFYQSRGFRLVALHRDAVTRARRNLKPEIALIGAEGIPIRDEIELELPRGEWQDFLKRYSWPPS